VFHESIWYADPFWFLKTISSVNIIRILISILQPSFKEACMKELPEQSLAERLERKEIVLKSHGRKEKK